MSQIARPDGLGWGNGAHAIEVSTPLCTGKILLRGAQVTEWTPHGAQPVLWSSANAVSTPDKAFRGGVPICFPWFGDGRSHRHSPAHGPARLAMWALSSADSTPGGEVSLGFDLDPQVLASVGFAADAQVRLLVSMGAALQMSLVVRAGSKSCHFEDALHNYFAVSDVTSTHIVGLDAARYLDQLAGRDGQLQAGTITFDGPIDRVYQSVANVAIVDPGLGRTIHIEKSGSGSTVGWNPWTPHPERHLPMAPGEWQHMLCVETANALADEVYLEAGEEHVLSQVISLG